MSHELALQPEAPQDVLLTSGDAGNLVSVISGKDVSTNSTSREFVHSWQADPQKGRCQVEAQPHASLTDRVAGKLEAHRLEVLQDVLVSDDNNETTGASRGEADGDLPTFSEPDAHLSGAGTGHTSLSARSEGADLKDHALDGAVTYTQAAAGHLHTVLMKSDGPASTMDAPCPGSASATDVGDVGS